MSWYTVTYRRRAAITVRNTGGTATIDFDTTIPKDLDEFWDVIDTAANNLRVTAADGFTLVTYDVDNGSGGAFDKTNRLGRIRVDAATAYSTADEILLFWVYYDPDVNVADGSSAVAMASIQTGFIDRGAPVWMGSLAVPERVGTDRPRYLFTKDSTETIHVWIDLADMLERRRTPYAKRKEYEEPRRLTYTAVDQTGAAAATLVDASGVRFVEAVGKGGRFRRLYARIPVTAGTDGTNYTVRATVYTEIPPQTVHRILRLAFGVRVKNKLEPAT